MREKKSKALPSERRLTEAVSLIEEGHNCDDEEDDFGGSHGFQFGIFSVE